MGQMKDGLAYLLNFFSILFFHLNSGTIPLAQFCEGQSQVIGPSQPIVASVGDDIILPCYLEPPINAGGMTVEWSRLDLNPRFVHVWHEGQDFLDDQNPSYRGRTSLFVDKLKLGDVSLKLLKVQLSDKGRYRCLLPDLDAHSFIDLAISSTSSPVIAGIDANSGELMLQCESKHWYPEPEVLWLDGEGHVLSAGPTETVRGPDDLYTVSSRVTVDKSNNLTCRVQQNIINQTRETHFKVSGDFATVRSHFAVPVTISVIVALLCIIAVFAFIFWKRNKTKQPISSSTGNENGQSGEEEGLDRSLKLITSCTSLMEEEKENQPVEDIKKKDELRKKRENLDVELKKKEEELEILAEATDSLTEQKEELKKLTQQGRTQTGNIEKLMDDYEKQAESLNEEIEQNNVDKAQGYLKLRKIMTDGNWSVRKVLQEQESVQLNAQKVQQKTEALLRRITEWKKELESHVERSRKELEEADGEKNSNPEQSRHVFLHPEN